MVSQDRYTELLVPFYQTIPTVKLTTPAMVVNLASVRTMRYVVLANHPCGISASHRGSGDLRHFLHRPLNGYYPAAGR